MNQYFKKWVRVKYPEGIVKENVILHPSFVSSCWQPTNQPTNKLINEFKKNTGTGDNIKLETIGKNENSNKKPKVDKKEWEVQI